MVGVSHPREGRRDGYTHDDTCDNPRDQNGIVIVLVVGKNHNDAEY